MLMEAYWKGRTVFQVKTVPTRKYHSNAPPENIAAPKEEPEPTQPQSFSARTPFQKSQGLPDQH